VPASRLALRLTDAYRDRLLRLRDRALGLIANRWRSIELDALDDSYQRWLTSSTTLTSTTQQQSVRLTAAYLGAFIAAELGEPPEPVGVEEGRYAGVGQDGRPMTEILAPGLITVKRAITDRRPPQRALQMGLNRATRTIASELLWSSRQALADAMERDERVTGWRRVTSRNPCGACLASATGTILEPAELPRTHPHCRCTAEPVASPTRERFPRLTGRELFDRMTREQQDELFRGRGGAEKAELLRSGAVPLEALIAVSPMATQDDVLTEAPLSALRN